MLSQSSIQKLAKLAKLTPEALTAEINKPDEVELAIDENLTVLTTEELSARDNVKVGEGKRLGESEGEKKGKELAIKAIKKKLNLDTEEKDIDKVAEAIQGKIGGGDATLKEQVTLLQQSLAQKENEINNFKTEAEAAKFDATLLSSLPANKTKALTNQEHLTIIKTNLEFTADGVKYKGAILRDPTTQAPLTADKALEHFYNDRQGLIDKEQPPKGGRGGGNDAGGNVKGSLKQLRKDYLARNPGANILSEEFQLEVREALKANPDMDMNDDDQ